MVTCSTHVGCSLSTHSSVVERSIADDTSFLLLHQPALAPSSTLHFFDSSNHMMKFLYLDYRTERHCLFVMQNFESCVKGCRSKSRGINMIGTDWIDTLTLLLMFWVCYASPRTCKLIPDKQASTIILNTRLNILFSFFNMTQQRCEYSPVKAIQVTGLIQNCNDIIKNLLVNMKIIFC